jgi:hypothetical protein
MIETEKATAHLDLPHAYREAAAATRTCECGRVAEAALHGPTLTEQASHRAPLIETEKGS